jgi:hypothetical protein
MTETTMDAKAILMLASAGIVALFGVLHLAYTFRGPKLLPRDPGLVASMKAVTLTISRETTVWRAWLGFNASHSMALLLFGLVYGHLAVAHPGVLYGSAYLQLLGFLMLAGLLLLAWRYWFRAPFVGIVVALACYVASVLAART